MKKACLVLLFIVGFSAGAWADETPVQSTATIGGGVAHPWKSPYRTAAGNLPTITPAQ